MIGPHARTGDVRPDSHQLVRIKWQIREIFATADGIERRSTPVIPQARHDPYPQF
jgi:hypothetical protein